MQINYFSQQTSFELDSQINLLNKSELLEIINKFRNSDMLGLDLETTGLSPIHDRVIMLILGTVDTQLVIDTRGFDFSLLKDFLEEDRLYVGHNIKFDYNMLKQYDILLPRVYDTMVIERAIYNGKYTAKEMREMKRFSLKTVMKNYFDVEMGKDTREEFLSIGSSPFQSRHIIYGAQDVIAPLRIKEVQEYWINKYNLQKTRDLENITVLSVGDMEYNGIFVDDSRWLKIHSKYYAKEKETVKKLDKILIDKEPKYEVREFQLNLFRDVEQERFTAVNWNSSTQVYKILTKIFNIYPEDKDGNPSSGTEALTLLDEKPPIVETLIQFRKETKVISSFGKKFLEEHRDTDGRLRANFNQIIDTGRMSSYNPNMQQIPGEEEFRKAFTAIPGKRLITADYSNQEGRIMADRANDEDYIHFFNYGDGDAHSFVATKMFSAAFGKEFIVTSENENKAYRKKGKTLNFSISFGGSAFSLSKTLKISEEEAQGLVDSFFKGFPKLKILFDTNKNFALKHGFIRTNPITGRIRWIPEWDEFKRLSSKKWDELTKEERKLKSKLKGRVQRKGMNTPIQGTAGDMTKTALILIRKELMKLGIRPTLDASIKIVNAVHDEIVLEADEKMAEVAAKILKYSMERAGEIFVKSISMIADPFIGDHWKHD